MFQIDNQLDVIQDVSLGVRQLEKQFAFKVLKQNLELILFLNEVEFLLGQVGSFSTHDKGKQLISQTFFSDSEVNQGGFSLHLWGVMRVGKLGMQEHSEVGMEGQVLTRELHDFVSSSLDDLSGNDGHQDGVDGLVHILDHDRVTSLDGHFNISIDVLRAQSHTDQVISFLLFFDPDVSLQLGVDDQGVTFGRSEDGTIFNGHGIRRQTISVPNSNLSFIRQNLDWVDFGSHRDLVLDEIFLEEIVDHMFSVLLIEGTGVGDESGGNEHVTSNQLLFGVDSDDGIGPTFVLGTQRSDQSLSQVQSGLATVGLFQGSVFLSHG